LMRLLFVCLGNICRSPLAEVVFDALAREEGIDLEVDSAGTAGYHRGEQADPRARACAARHGLAITHRARPLVDEDFDRFDLLLVMDESNLAEVRRRAPDARARAKVRLLREHDAAGTGEVPDPYYGGDEDFEHVFHLCERSASGWLRVWREASA